MKYEHPRDLVAALLAKTDLVFGCLSVPVHGYMRIEQLPPPAFGDDEEDEYKKLEGGQWVTLWSPEELRTVQERIDVAASMEMSRLEAAGVDEELREWGIRVCFGEKFLAAVDLAPNVSDKGARKVALEFGALCRRYCDAPDLVVHGYATGNGIHLYASALIGIELFPDWAEGLRTLPGVDKFWVKNMGKPGHGVLRWSGGSNGRHAPKKIFEVQGG